jgi:hypothetical protein
MVPLWNWGQRHGFGPHGDGLNTSPTEIFLNSVIGHRGRGFGVSLSETHKKALLEYVKAL